MAQQMAQLPALPSILSGGESDRPIGWFLIACRLLLIVSMIAATVFASSSTFGGPAAAFSGLALMIGAAGFAGGGLLGFLFGVPRMLGGGAIGSGPAQVVSNNNVEQLSDWLTKILVGVGLVEIHQVGPLLAGFRDQIDHALASPSGDTLPGAGLAACLILTGSTIAGFLTAYLKSRTDLMRAFREPLVVPSALGDIHQRLIGDSARAVLDRPSTQPDRCAREHAARLVEIIPARSDDPELCHLAGLAHAVLKNFASAADALRTAAALRARTGLPADPALDPLATRAAALAGDDGIAEPTGADPETEQALATMFACLYTASGYEAAIAIGERLAGDEQAAKSGRLWLYLARAWGQRHAVLMRRPQPHDDEAITIARESALAAARNALGIDRANNEPALRLSLSPTRPGQPSTDTDLATLHDDPAFTNLLAPA